MKRFSLYALVATAALVLAGPGFAGGHLPTGAAATLASSTSWQVTSPLVNGRIYHSTFVAEGSGGSAYVYVTGGQYAGFHQTTERAPILPGGGLGTWQVISGADIPEVRRTTNAVQVGEYVYLVGGRTADESSLDSTVRARVLADGTLEDEGPGGQSAWKTMSATLNTARQFLAVVSADVDNKTFLYAIGGASERTVERAEVLSDGTLGAWDTLTCQLVQANGLNSMIAYVAGGYVYVVGGWDGNGALTDVVQRANIDTDGTLGAFSQLAENWPTARQDVGWAVAGNTLYLLGGWNGNPVGNVDAAPLATDGSPQWAMGPSLNVPRQYPNGVAHEGRVYAVGGNDSSGLNVVEVLGITPVGGVAELSALAGTSAGKSAAPREESGPLPAYAVPLAVGLAVVVAVGAGAWYTRRRWLR